ncbi:hypothetical protein [uncultured Chitinophaga sp.]|jgi:hypothetical protein|uniref:hypothetical protein n=1 Tax=uncultured Chitinophaga sp. TaxID=339340 RepID=UPI00262F8A6C|nr:hypothetical protein [uncultured Chitinophaga sp.]
MALPEQQNKRNLPGPWLLKLEGNTLTYSETGLLLIFDKTTGNHELREYEEMKAHDVAFELIKEWAADPAAP